MTDTIRILGIDPGTNIMGYGVIEVKDSQVRKLATGVINLRNIKNSYEKLGHIFNQIQILIKNYSPNEFAIEAPFYGKNVQSMLKLGRAQGVAIAAAIHKGIPIFEYAPLKIKMAITGEGKASKEQVAKMLTHLLNTEKNNIPKYLDETDALAVAYCHYLQKNKPRSQVHYKNWQEYIIKNKDKISIHKTI